MGSEVKYKNIVKLRSEDDVKYFHDLKKQMFDTEIVWNNNNGEWSLPRTWHVSSDMSLCKRYRPTSYADFYEKYVSEGEGIKVEPQLPNSSYGDRCKVGRTEEYLLELSRKFKELYEEKRPSSKGKFSLSQYYDLIVCHVIVETYDGWRREQDVIDAIKRAHPDCVFHDPTPDLDCTCGVDLIVEGKNNDKKMVQIKPESFFKSSMSSTKNDREAHRTGGKKEQIRKKYLESHKELGITDNTLYFIVYRKDEGLLKRVVNGQERLIGTFEQWRSVYDD